MGQLDATRLVAGLEAIIDAASGVLAEQSLDATLHEMARALRNIVPYTSLAIYEADEERRVLVPVFATGNYVEETLSEQPRIDDSISGRALLSGKVLNLEPTDPLIAAHQMPGTPADEGEAFLVAPLLAGDRPLGTLNIWREGEQRSFSAAEERLAQRFATLAAIAYNNVRARERLRRQAITDELTGLFNRRHFTERMQEELARVRRHGGSLALVLLDVDDFKAINDRHGHPVGDAALRLLASVLLTEARAEDVVCRVGGEEFAVILPSTGADEAAVSARRWLSAIAATPAPGDTPIGASAGIALAPADAATVDDLFRIADERLLAAKAGGKGRAVGP
jgi:diguanylate cyclase (GGDEF)-like protein